MPSAAEKDPRSTDLGVWILPIAKCVRPFRGSTVGILYVQIDIHKFRPIPDPSPKVWKHT